jgi:hypothetical protein
MQRKIYCYVASLLLYGYELVDIKHCSWKSCNINMAPNMPSLSGLDVQFCGLVLLVHLLITVITQEKQPRLFQIIIQDPIKTR